MREDGSEKWLALWWEREEESDASGTTSRHAKLLWVHVLCPALLESHHNSLSQALTTSRPFHRSPPTVLCPCVPTFLHPCLGFFLNSLKPSHPSVIIYPMAKRATQNHNTATTVSGLRWFLSQRAAMRCIHVIFGGDLLRLQS